MRFAIYKHKAGFYWLPSYYKYTYLSYHDWDITWLSWTFVKLKEPNSEA